ncbi:hypothetical protein EU527_19580 [Candidatus Thorarchaeota archaeon]|nr:MAG: hypothetical protein EU527_19580 [Candidatus Thorarchaeota archaeon]
MPRHRILLTVAIGLTLLSTISLLSTCSPVVDNGAISSWSGGLIIDHNCINQRLIPSEWIESAKNDVRIHYAHTSHGSQITEGLTRLESANSTFDVSIGYLTLPTDDGALCILDGNPPHDYITPELYWQGTSARAITQNTINNHPTLTISLWSWCCQLYDYSEAATQEYLDAMNTLETANLDITFIYMTCNAQSDDSSGYNRWLRNEQIRQYCLANNKVLFDFADLDCWSDGEQSTYDYVVGEETIQIPIEHEDFNGDEAGHTTYTSCEQKGRAFWWMMAMLTGWNAPDSTSTTTISSGAGSSSTTTTGLTTEQLYLDNVIVFSAIAVAALLVIYAGARRYYN